MTTVDYDYLVKTVVVGDSGVGKSCLLKRFADNEFDDSYVSTIGVDFAIKTIDMQGKVAKLQLWDTAGQERFQGITTSYYRGAHAIMVVCDVTELSSLWHVDKWMKEIRTYAGDDTPVVLVGNKTDLKAKRVVSEEMMLKKAGEYDLPYVETSAKNAVNVEKCFRTLVEEYISRPGQFISTKPSNSPSSGINIETSSSSSSLFSCCTIQ